MVGVQQRTYSVKEVANVLRVSESMIYGMARRGEIVAIRIGDLVLFSEKSLAERWPEVFGDSNRAA